MRAFTRNPLLTSKERTEKRRNRTLYNSLRQTPTDNRTYQIKDDYVISRGYQDKYNMVSGREHFLQTQGTPSQKEKVYGRILRDEQSFLPKTLDDYKYRKFDADVVNRVNETYPGQDIDGENYIYNLPIHIYNLPIHIYYDNANNDNNNLINPGEMTQTVYDTYKYFLSYPYTLDPSGNIDYSIITNHPTVDKYFIVAETSSSDVYKTPKSLIRQPLKLD